MELHRQVHYSRRMLTPSPARLDSRRWATPGNPLVKLPLVRLTALYEDLEAGLRAKRLLEGVETTVKAQLPVCIKAELWRFDWLKEKSLRNMALSMAKESALVLVSASTNNPPPVEFQRWLKAWSQSREQNLSALVLLARPRPYEAGPHALHDCLERAARHKDVEFLCEFLESSAMADITPAWALNREEAFCS